MKKRILSLLLTLVMVISLIPTTAWAAEGSITVTFSAQKEGEFLFTPQTVTVQDGLAEAYGYTMPATDHNNVSINAPTVFDAMVAVHKAKYGDAFNSETAMTYLEFNSSGTLTKAFGETTSASGFFVNHDMLNDGISGDYGTTGYMINAARLKNNDIVDFWFYQSTSWSDHFTYFTDSAKSVATDEPFDLTLTGFPAMNAMGYTPTSTPIDGTDTEGGTYLTINTVDTDGNLSAALTDASDTEITPDATGKVTLSFDTAGKYIVTANGFVGGNPAIAPWCIVIVTDATTGGGAETGGTTGTTTATKTLSSLSFYKANKTDSPALTLSPEFNSSAKTYDLPVFDQDGANLFVTATPTTAGDTVKAEWTRPNNSSTGTGTATVTSRTNLTNCIKQGTTGNTVKLTVGEGDDAGIYTVNVKRTPTLKALSITSATFDQPFVFNTLAYTSDIPSTPSNSVTFSATGYDPSYTITYNDSDSSTVELNAVENIVRVKVTNPANDLSTIYTVTINCITTVDVTFSTTPSNASVVVYDKYHSVVESNADGSYPMMVGQPYSYTVTKAGSKSATGTYTPNSETTQTVTVTLADAGTAGSHPTVDAAWWNFRNSDVNMGITGAKTPISDAVLKWSTKTGSSWSDTPSVPIIVGDHLIVMSNTSLRRIDLTTGTLDTTTVGTLKIKNQYNTIPPTYAEGLIICQLNDGTIQAFDATTLESVWVYQDPLKGQPVSPITYSGGYIYTGFWNGETEKANYVCLSLTDEDPDSENEAKYATWSKTVPGGFYWAGSVVVGNALIVGSDDGASDSSGTSHLYALNKTTGKEISKLPLTDLGDQRSSIAYDSASKCVYFTTKGGYLCSAAVAADGTLSDPKQLNMGMQSTSTPIVYGGYVYVCAGIPGTNGSGFFIVADAENLTEVSRVSMKAYPQCSPLLSTAYESSGYLCFYCTYNGNPGGISLIKVNTTTHQATLTELFTPDKSMQNYCICSVICDNDGTLYYKNDSGNVFAVSDNATIAAAVTAKINAIGTVTLDSEAKINTARSAYDALTDAQKLLVSNYGTLTAAEATLAGLKNQAAADAVKAKINAIGEVTLDSEAKINDASSAYDALTAAQKELVTNYNILTAAKAKLAELKADKAAADAVKAKINDIGEVTLDSESAINAARSAYNALTAAQKELVTNYSTLTDAEATLAALKAQKAAADRAAADDVIGKIDAVTSAIEGGDTDAIKSAIADAKAAYNNLTAAQKALVTNYDVLTAADSKYNPTGSKHEHTRRQPSTTGTANGTTANTKDDVKSPATGDGSHMLLWMSGMLLSAAAIAVLTTKKKRSAR